MVMTLKICIALLTLPWLFQTIQRSNWPLNFYQKSPTNLKTSEIFPDSLMWTSIYLNKNPPLKILINSGEIRSILSLFISEKYYAEKIIQCETHLKTVLYKCNVIYKAAIDEGSKFNINYQISFISFQFQYHFDGLIGLNDIRNMNLFVDFTC